MEIVGPAGNFEKMKAAIKGGASEVFFGLKGFGARRNNENFNIKEVLDGVDYSHSKGVKTLLTLNTIMKDTEIINAVKNFLPLYTQGVDSVIVQDLGFIKYLKKQFPKLILHGSTQMTVANHYEANFLQKMGLNRVVLARELSYDEIKSIREKTSIELEVFVSGSMCISYSGNCYVSSFIGGRSGNRGMCAYTCRKRFKDEENNYSYILSPNDQLLQKEEILKLKEIGIDAIKVEGRKKHEHYVYETVSYYRDILNGIDRKSESYKLFNRGYSKGYFYLDDNLMNFKYPSNFGYLIGVVNNKKIKLLDDLILGDGIQFVDKEFKVLGGEYVNKIKTDNGLKEQAKKGEEIILKFPDNTKYVYKNYSKEINDRIENKLKIEDKKIPINIEFNAKLNEKLKIKMYLYNLKNKKIEVEYEDCDILSEISKKKITINDIIEKLGELGNTDYYLSEENIKIEYDEIAFIPFSKIKNIRRKLVEELKEKLIDSYRRKEVEYNEKEQLTINEKKPYIFSALVSTKEQEKACIEYGINKIYYSGYDIAKEKNLDNKLIDNTNLIYNIYHLDKAIRENKYNQVVNWNLNIFNNYTVKVFDEIKNIDTIFISPELNYRQIKRINSNRVKLGMVIYGRLKAMYIEHKIFDKEYKEIEGEFFDRYKLKKNELDNIELYLHMPMNLIPKLDKVEELGMDELRLDFTFETYEETKKILESIQNKKGKYTPYAFEMGVS